MSSSVYEQEIKLQSKPSFTYTRSPEYANRISCYLPDILIDGLMAQDVKVPSSRKCDGVVLFVDVSGFTALCEKYSESAQCINNLTTTLNNYIGQIVQILLEHDADIYKFAGDAILCHWSIDNPTDKNYESVLHTAITSAILIQKYLSNYQTSIDVILNMKIAIAHGTYIFHLIGTNQYNNIMFVGPAIKELNKVEKYCHPGDVLVSAESWKLLRKTNYNYKTSQSAPYYVKIFSIISNTNVYKHSITTNFVKCKTTNSSMDIQLENTTSEQNDLNSIKSIVTDYINLQKRCERSLSSCGSHTKLFKSSLKIDFIDTNIKLRKCFTREYDRNKIKILKSFIVSSVLQKIDDKQPVKYLSELRQVSIVFLNLDLKFDKKPDNYCLSDYIDVKPYQHLFVTIDKSIGLFGGVLTKTLAFDKGYSFLCVFGLPGNKRENDSYHALTCANKLYETLNKLEFVRCVSIGVTSGLTFTGVVGHPFRCEYTVIGRKVNLAARLMTAYTGMVTCDEETYTSSRLVSNHFKELLPKPLRGIKNPGIIRKYEEKHCDEIRDIETFEFPIVGKAGFTLRLLSYLDPITYLNVTVNCSTIGRDDELTEFRNCLAQIFNKNGTSNKRNFILIHGSNGIGKTRFLDAIIKYIESELKFMTVSLKVNIDEYKTKYNTICNIIMAALKMYKLTDSKIESILNELFVFSKDRRLLYLFNDFYKTNFIKPTKYDSSTSNLLRELCYTALKKVIKAELHKGKYVSSKYCVVIVDDAHFCDLYSWRSILDFQNEPNIIFVLAINTPEDSALLTSHRYISETTVSEFFHKAALPTLLCIVLWAFCFLLLHICFLKLIIEDLAYHIQLKGIHASYLSTIACQMLDVIKIPAQLHTILIENSLGVPAWCEQLLKELYYTNQIKIQEASDRTDEQKLYVYGFLKYLERVKHKSPRGSIVTNASKTDTRPDSTKSQSNAPNMVCTIANSNDLSRIKFPTGLRNQLIARIDRLNPDEALVAKCAAHLGITFLRSMLEDVLTDIIPLDRVQASIRSLEKQSIFKCGSAPNKIRSEESNPGFKMEPIMTHPKLLLCYCFPTLRKDRTSLSGIGSQLDLLQPTRTSSANIECRLLTFTSSLLQEIAEGLLTEDVSKSIHNNAGVFLESRRWNCRSCGGDNLSLGLGSYKPDYLKSSYKMDSKDIENMAIEKAYEHARTHSVSELSRQTAFAAYKREGTLDSYYFVCKKETEEVNERNTGDTISVLKIPFDDPVNSNTLLNKFDENLSNISEILNNSNASLDADQTPPEFLDRQSSRQSSLDNVEVDKIVNDKLMSSPKTDTSGEQGSQMVLSSTLNDLPARQTAQTKSNILWKKNVRMVIERIRRQKEADSLDTYDESNVMRKTSSNKSNAAFEIEDGNVLRFQFLFAFKVPIKCFEIDYVHPKPSDSFQFCTKTSQTTLQILKLRNDLLGTNSSVSLTSSHAIRFEPNSECDQRSRSLKSDTWLNDTYELVDSLQDKLAMLKTDKPDRSSMQNFNISIYTKNCKCNLISCTILPQLIKHWDAVDNKEKKYFCQIEYAECLLKQNQAFKAYETLTKAKEVLQCVKYYPVNDEICISPEEEAKLYNLLGIAHYKLNEYGTSIREFNKSLELTENRRNRLSQTLFYDKFIYNMKKRNWFNTIPRNMTVLMYHRYKEASVSYTYLYEIYRQLGDHPKCKDIAYRHSSIAEILKVDLKIISIAYSQLIEQSVSNAQRKEFIKRALKISRTNLLDILDFQSLAQIYYTAFLVYFNDGSLCQAIRYGLTCRMLLAYINDNDSIVKIYPQFILCAFCAFESKTTLVALLDDFEETMYENNSLISFAWHTCFVIELALLAGNLDYATMETAIESLEKRIDPSLVKSEPLSCFYFFCTLIQICTRRYDFKNAKRFYRRAVYLLMAVKSNNYLYVSSVLRLIEYQLIIFSHHQSQTNKEKLKLLIDRKTGFYDSFNACKSKLYYYRAYYYKILNNLSKVKSNLQTALNLALKLNLSRDVKVILKAKSIWLPNTKPTKTDASEPVDEDSSVYVLPVP